MSGDQRPSYSNPVKAWTDPAVWAERLTPAGCPFCQSDPRSVHVELPASWVLIPDEAVLPGYVLVVSKRHVIEPYELPPDQSAQFWADAMRAAAAVASVVNPVKVNYEIHGNTIPHLHLHVFPRFRGDPFERSPIDPHAVTPQRRSADEIEALRKAVADGSATTSAPGGSVEFSTGQLMRSKLVRDRIPELILRHGGQPRVRRLDDEEFVIALGQKLIEEAAEVAADPTAEEMADVREVLEALAAAHGIDDRAIEAARHAKVAERGAFRDRILLEEPIEASPPMEPPAPSIRPIVIGVAVNDDRIFVVEGHDRLKGQTFYRPPGGGIEFGEISEAALRRELVEELDVEPTSAQYIGTLENVFTYDGQPGHEVVAVYRVELPPEDRLRFDTVVGRESDGTPFAARWLLLDRVRDGSAILYPDGLLELLDRSRSVGDG